jgi:uncharacterized protein (DUF58 family)
LELLNAQTLARLAGVKLRARAVVDGVLSGLHKSPHQGQSVEFAEHKEYAPGDEVRHIDWKAFGKFDKYYVKRFEHETNLQALLVLDGSASMGYQSGPLSKLEVAKTLAGALAYLLVRQQDAAGLAVVTGEGFSDLPARSAAGHLRLLLEELESVMAHGTTNLFQAAEHLAEHTVRRSLIAIFSDLFDDRADALRRILQLRARKNDLAIFHVLDPAELTFPFDDPTLFLSMEDDRRIEVNPREIKKSYLEEFSSFVQQVKSKCAEADADYELVRTDDSLDAVLLRFLAKRQERRR